MLLLFLGLFLVSCDEAEHHDVLTFFFEGVPPLHGQPAEELVDSDMMQIYLKHVMHSNGMKFTNDNELNDLKVKENYSRWVKGAIAALVCLGWFGLTFKK